MAKLLFELPRGGLYTSLLFLLLTSGCTASAKLGESTGPGDTTTGDTQSTVGGGGSGGGGAGGGSGGLLDTGGQDGAPQGEIFVHDQTALYRFDPIASQITFVGLFDCVLADPSGSADSGMHDIALDKDGVMYGVAKMGGQSPGSFQDHVIVAIDRTTGHCTKEIVVPKYVADPVSPVEVRGLSFVPAGTIEPDEEVLVGLDISSAYLRVDLASKTVTLQGNLNGDGPQVWWTKGADVVSIIGDKTYVTAKNGESTDRVALMDPVTGAITQGLAPTSLVTIGGMAYWGGTLYAFTVEGNAYSIDPATGEPTPITIGGAPPGIQYHGAGVTTAAPLSIPE